MPIQETFTGTTAPSIEQQLATVYEKLASIKTGWEKDSNTSEEFKRLAGKKAKQLMHTYTGIVAMKSFWNFFEIKFEDMPEDMSQLKDHMAAANTVLAAAEDINRDLQEMYPAR